jgi:hypothetical protein
MIKNALLALIVICCLLFTVGCGNDKEAFDIENAISVEVANMTEGIIVSYALLYGNDLDEWGEELLGDEVISPGDVHTFLIPEGIYTIILMTYEYYVLPGARDFNTDIRIELGGNGLVPVLIKNNAERDIAYLFLLESVVEDPEVSEEDPEVPEEDPEVPEDSDEDQEVELTVSFDDDVLEEEVIPAGLGRIIFVKPGVYHFVGLDYDGEVILMGDSIIIEGEATITVQ